MATELLAPSKKVTFTLTATPHKAADQKTIQRLMRMQRSIQKGLRQLSLRRRREENITRPRAGGTWTNRVKMTKLIKIEKGESFTLVITPQILPDIQSVAKLLDMKPAK